jgi:hypothetical protein
VADIPLPPLGFRTLFCYVWCVLYVLEKRREK